jgi:hypothetical protein
MSYAYIQGQEAEALVFFQKLLSQALEPQERAALEELVEDLRQKVTSKDGQTAMGRRLQSVGAHNLQTC